MTVSSRVKLKYSHGLSFHGRGEDVTSEGQYFQRRSSVRAAAAKTKVCASSYEIAWHVAVTRASRSHQPPEASDSVFVGREDCIEIFTACGSNQGNRVQANLQGKARRVISIGRAPFHH